MSPAYPTGGGQPSPAQRPPGFGLGAFAGNPMGYLKDQGKQAVSPFTEMAKGISDGYKAAQGGLYGNSEPW